MHQRLLVSKYTALIGLIYGKLTELISTYAQSKKNIYIQKTQIPLSKGKSDIKISYVSAVALHLSKSHNSQPFELASSIASHLSANCGEHLLVQVFPPGLIEIQVSDFVLAVWLQGFIDNRRGERINLNRLVSGKAVISEFDPESLFSIQYVHARCCSLLRLAQQEKLIDSNQICLESIPWLNSGGELRLNHRAERRLISSLVKVVDELEPIIVRPLKWEGVVLSLVKAFESFWSACRICGDVKTSTPELFMARVGLVMITQSVLKFVLEEKLGVSACLEL